MRPSRSPPRVHRLSIAFTGWEMGHLPTIQWLSKCGADPFTAPAGKCVDAFDNRMLRGPLARPPAPPLVTQRGRKRDHFERYVTLAACALRNMSHRRRPRSGWHVGCNYDQEQRDSKKKKARVCCAIGRDRQQTPGTDITTRTAPAHKQATKDPAPAGSFFWRLPAWKHRQMPGFMLGVSGLPRDVGVARLHFVDPECVGRACVLRD